MIQKNSRVKIITFSSMYFGREGIVESCKGKQFMVKISGSDAPLSFSAKELEEIKERGDATPGKL